MGLSACGAWGYLLPPIFCMLPGEAAMSARLPSGRLCKYCGRPIFWAPALDGPGWEPLNLDGTLHYGCDRKGRGTMAAPLPSELPPPC